jgi:hypothetical protein
MKRESYISPESVIGVIESEQCIMVTSGTITDGIIDIPDIAGPPPMEWN